MKKGVTVTDVKKFCETCGKVEFEGYVWGKWVVRHLVTQPDGTIYCTEHAPRRSSPVPTRSAYFWAQD